MDAPLWFPSVLLWLSLGGHFCLPVLGLSGPLLSCGLFSPPDEVIFSEIHFSLLAFLSFFLKSFLSLLKLPISLCRLPFHELFRHFYFSYFNIFGHSNVGPTSWPASVEFVSAVSMTFRAFCVEEQQRLTRVVFPWRKACPSRPAPHWRPVSGSQVGRGCTLLQPHLASLHYCLPHC